MEVYLNPNKTIQERVTDLINKMTLKEKVGQLNQRIYGWETYEKTEDGIQLTNVLKDYVAWGGGMGTLYGLFRADPWSRRNYSNGIPSEDSWKVANEIQKYVLEHSRLKIPVLFSEDSSHGPQTLGSVTYSTNIGKGASWNPDLVEETTANMAEELSTKGVPLALVSALDLARDPRWGRTEECFSEDPYLSSVLTERTVYGFQGRALAEFNDLLSMTTSEIQKEPNKIGIVLKHFVAQGDAIGGHNSGPTNIGPRELREIALPAMKKGAAANALGVMAAYNEIDGIPCHANSNLLTTILKEEMNFQGFVMADGCALDRLLLLTGDKELAANMALEAGVDVSLWDDVYTHIESGVKNGKIKEELVNKAVERILAVKFILGLFENPFVEEPQDLLLKKEKWQESNLQLAKESLTLLKNENQLLPISTELKNIAVIGPNANQLYNQLGDYTAPQDFEYSSTILEGIKKIVSPDVNVSYCKGCEIRDTSETNLNEAIALAEKSDVVILCLGGSSARNFDMEFLSNGAVSSKGINMDSGENVDLADLSLGGDQLLLAKALQATGTPIIVVLIQGRPHVITELYETVPAILCTWYPGQRGGEAVAQALFGKFNPSGKLPVSIPKSSNQLPVYYNQKNAGGKADYYDEAGAPLLPFGYGLSYTNFEYKNLTIENKVCSIQKLEAGESIEIEISVSNIGKVTGQEVVQLYIYDQEASVTRRKKELKGFEKVELSPNETKIVKFKLSKEELAIWDKNLNFTIEPGHVKIMIGDCEDIITLI